MKFNYNITFKIIQTVNQFTLKYSRIWKREIKSKDQHCYITSILKQPKLQAPLTFAFTTT